MIVFLDIDGTVVDHTTRAYMLYRKYAEAHGFPVLSKEAYVTRKRKGVAEEKFGGRVYVEWKRKHIEDLHLLSFDTLIPGIKRKLRNLAQKHTLVALSARQSRAKLVRQLTALGVRKYFTDILVGGNKATIAKAYLAKDPRAALFIGDTMEDALAAREIGIGFVKAPWV